MIIIAGHLIVSANSRDRMVQAMQDLVRRARSAEGCIELAITADPTDARRVQNLEIWADADALDRWRAEANAPDPGVEIVEDHVLRYDASDGGPMFP